MRNKKQRQKLMTQKMMRIRMLYPASKPETRSTIRWDKWALEIESAPAANKSGEHQKSCKFPYSDNPHH